jgi:NADH-quinone oxidoreductase subunit N
MMPSLATAWLPSGAELRLFSPELALVGTIAAVLLAPLFVGRKPYLAAHISMGGALVGLFATALVVPRVVDAGVGALTPPSVPPMLVADRFTVFFKLFLLMLLVVIIWLWMIGATERASRARSAARLEPNSVDSSGPAGAHEFFVLLLTSAVGMMLMVGTLNLLVIVIAIETASLPSYAIVASNKCSRRGAEAALKYVMFGAAAAAIMVYGASLLYGHFGTLDISTIAGRVGAGMSAHAGPAESTLQTGVAPGADAVFWLGLLAFGVGILFKIAAVPMHLWCPDVFEGAPIEVTTWLSVASKAAGLGLLLRIVDAFSVNVGHAGPMLQAGVSGALSPSAPSVGALAPLTWGIGALAAVTCTVGNLAALRQESVKRILAYSSIAHAGYMLMAAAIFVGPSRSAGPNPAVNAGISAVIAYLFVYVTMNVGAFGATALVSWRTGSDHLSAFTGLGRRAPWLALPMAVCRFSLVGLPPLGGFAAKWFLLVALGKSAAVQPWLWGLVMVAVVNTAISLYYYLRIVRQMYLTDDPAQPPLRLPLPGLALVNACAVLLLLLGTLWFSPLGGRADSMASNLFGHPARAPGAFERRTDRDRPVMNRPDPAATGM